ncbi:MAG TPA: helix-turn-helix transcriptional regulator [Verrucomicrobiae bacterium]|nr:helix-turn-helix transcriptional regulator [Verrucomicrobiae bacterium]
MSRSKIYQTVGENIRTMRRRARLTQEQLAEKTDLNTNYIGEIERAEKKITLETLEKIAKVLEVRISNLLGEN